MANTKQARKRARQTVARNLHLAAQHIADTERQNLVAAGDKAAAQEAFKAAESTIDKMARKGVLHGNAAARHKSRLAAEIKALA